MTLKGFAITIFFLTPYREYLIKKIKVDGTCEFVLTISCFQAIFSLLFVRKKIVFVPTI